MRRMGLAGERRGKSSDARVEADQSSTLLAASLPAAVRRRGVAFFDLDHTIIDVNSSWLWVKSEFGTGRGVVDRTHPRVSRFEMGSFGSTGPRRTGSAGKDAASLYKGESEQSFRERITNFFRMELAHRARPGFKRVLDALLAEVVPALQARGSGPRRWARHGAD